MWTEFWANIRLFYSNFNAEYGALFNIIALSAVLAFLCLMLIRTALVGDNKKSVVSLSDKKPDPKLTEQAAQSLSKAVQIPSVTGDKAQTAKLVDFLRSNYTNVMNTLGVISLPSGSMLLRWRAPHRTNELPVMLCAHLDVVPAGEGFTTPPFSGARKDGYIHGRGAIDCKGSLIGLLEAVSSLIDEGFFPRRDIYFAFGHDEETGGTEGAKEIAEVLKRKGIIFEMILDEGGYIAEDFMGKAGGAAALIGVGEKASCNFTVTASARGGHSSMPEHRSTVGALSEALCRIEIARPRTKLLPVVKKYLRRSAPFMPFKSRFIVCNMPLTGAFLSRTFRDDPSISSLLRTTVVPTQLEGSEAPNIIPSQATAKVNARLLPGDTSKALHRRLEDLVRDLPVSITLDSGSECPSITDTAHPMYRMLCKTLTDYYPMLPCIPTLLTGSTDSKHYDSLSACVLRFTPVVLGEPELSGIHAADECLRESSLGCAVEVYKTLLKKM